MSKDPVYRVFGLGGAGGRIANAVARATAGRLPAYAVDCDTAALAELPACQPLRLDDLPATGAGGDAAKVTSAARAQSERFHRALEDVSMAVVVAWLGGGAGSGLLPVLLDVCSERNVRTMVFLVRPFAFEGTDRLRAAGSALSAVEDRGDLRIVVSNDELVADLPQGATVEEAFAAATRTLADGVSLFWRLGAHPAHLALDPGLLLSFAVTGRGHVDFASGVATGPDRLSLALGRVLEGRGLGLSRRAEGARAALVGVVGGRDLRLAEVGDAVRNVAAILPPGAPVHLSAVLEPEAEGTLGLVVLLFRRWATAEREEAIENAAAAAPADGSPAPRHLVDAYGRPMSGRFDGVAPSLGPNGENLDDPTYLRRNLHIDFD